jgi:SAM-dependent methyltransferase
MSRVQASFFDRLYENAAGPEQLPWHRDEPPELLQRAGRALDVGCGAGPFSIYLAERGFAVTGLDFSQAAIDMAREGAGDAELQIDFRQADVLSWDGTEPFDIVLDSGCLHGFGDADRNRYKAHLLDWLAPGADYVLVHFEKRHALDWRPMGPRRFPAEQTIALFQPELEVIEHQSLLRKVPLPVGPTVRLGSYWFRRGD